MARKRLTDDERQERLARTHAQLHAAVATLTTGEAWCTYLKAMRRFHTYSASNVLMILSQRPQATQVAGFQTWRSLCRSVRKGTTGIAIFAPLARRVEVEDKDTGESAIVRAVVGFRIVYVFDVGDTDPVGETPAFPVEQVRPVLLDGEAPVGMWGYLVERVTEAGFALELDAEIPGHPSANGITDFLTMSVHIATSNRSSASQARTLAHELAHACLHGGNTISRSLAEVEAESVAFLIADAFGLDGSAYAVPYIANWGAIEPDAVLRSADRVMQTAKTILAKFEGGSEVVS